MTIPPDVIPPEEWYSLPAKAWECIFNFIKQRRGDIEEDWEDLGDLQPALDWLTNEIMLLPKKEGTA